MHRAHFEVRDEDQLDVAVEQSGRGGVVHRFWQQWIKESFEEAGWAASAELFDADVYVNMGDAGLVIEIALAEGDWWGLSRCSSGWGEFSIPCWIMFECFSKTASFPTIVGLECIWMR